MIEIAAIAVVAGGAIALRILASKTDSRAADEAWKTAARRVGGELDGTPAGWWSEGAYRITSTIEDVPLVIDMYSETHDRLRVVFTRVTVGPLPGSAGTQIAVAPRDLLHVLSRRLGIGELPTGDAKFDEACHVSGAPTAVVLDYLDRPTRLLVAEAQTQLELDGRLLRVIRRGSPSDAEPLVAMIRFAERLTARWRALLRGPTQLAERLGLTLEDHFELGGGERDTAGVPAQIDARVARGTLRARTITHSVRLQGESAFTVLAFDDDASAPDWSIERTEDDAFPSAAASVSEAVLAFGRAAPESLLGMRRVGGTIELVFAGLTPDHEEIEGALFTLMEAAAPLAPYR